MTRFTLALLITLLAATAIAADDPAPQFFIEKIDIRNTRHASPAIIVAETRLREGQSYTEADLREASYRVARLPFVLRAEYSLEKGTRRDAYVFVISVVETKRLFFDVDLTGDLGEDWDGSTHLNGWNDLVLGGRWFVGSKGVFHAAVGTIRSINDGNLTGDVRTIQAGYTQYDLFGTRAFVNFDLNYGYSGSSGSHPAPAFSLVLGVPVTANQTVTASIMRSSWKYDGQILLGGQLYPFNEENHSTSASLDWAYNTTDSPFFPTRGEKLDITAVRSQTRDENPAYSSGSRDGHSRSLMATAAKYWPLSERNSISATVQGAVNDSESRGSLWFRDGETGYHDTLIADRSNAQSLLVNFSHSFYDSKRMRLSGDHRIDFEAGVVRNWLSSEYDPNPYPDWPASFHGAHTYAHVGLWWARRNAWGMVRIGATYTW